MLRLIVVTLTFVSAICCIPPQLIALSRIWLCNELLNQVSYTSNTTVNKCVDEQAGLKEILAGFPNAALLLSEWKPEVIAGSLLAFGHQTEATALRKCYAREKNMLNADGTYNMDKLKADILKKVGFSECLANTQTGLQECPPVAGYDVYEYIHCVFNYCKIGVGYGASG